MRYVVFGAGAIGGLIGARLHQSGHNVVFVARGAHYEKLAADGLTLATPTERVTLRVRVARSAVEANLHADDIVLLCVKSQHTADALLAIRDAAPPGGVPVVCMQNAVENERTALRLFRDVYGSVLLLPAEYLEPGYIISYLSATSGLVYLGRYPAGIDARIEQVSAALVRSGFDVVATAQIMRHKHAKLIGNLENGIHAICGLDDPSGNRQLSDLVRGEGRRVLLAAGIEHTLEGTDEDPARRARVVRGQVDGHDPAGGSTWQSVMRGTGNVESDYLNGEIVLLGRKFGIATPFNELIQTLTRLTITDGRVPGWRSPAELIATADRSSARPN